MSDSSVLQHMIFISSFIFWKRKEKKPCLILEKGNQCSEKQFSDGHTELVTTKDGLSKTKKDISDSKLLQLHPKAY